MKGVLMARKKDETSGWLPCGCHILHKQLIVHCQFHQKASRMMGLLDALRRYFLDTTGEDSPFVKKIDELVPRRD
jgi:hypothetical protein